MFEQKGAIAMSKAAKGTRGLDGYQNDAPLEEMVVPNQAVYGLEKEHSAYAPNGVEADVYDDIVDQALQQLHLQWDGHQSIAQPATLMRRSHLLENCVCQANKSTGV